jgi:hypothetical protein
LSKITGNGVSSKVQSATSEVLTEEGSQVVGKLAGDTAGALVGSGVKGGENWAREQDKN